MSSIQIISFISTLIDINETKGKDRLKIYQPKCRKWIWRF